jgi:hypothetical protein
MILGWSRVSCALVLFLTTLASPLQSRAESEPISLELNPVKGVTKVGQGIPLRFDVVASNSSAEAQPVAFTLGLAQRRTNSALVRFAHWSGTVPPGKSIRRRFDVTTSQWFEATDHFEIRVVSERLYADPLEFRVSHSPVRVPQFEDVTVVVGLQDSIGEFKCGTWTAGAAWTDSNGDGELDLFVPRREAPARLWINRSGIFSEEAAPRGVADAGPMALGVSSADYDNDGDQDLYVTNEGPNRLFRNNGDGHFQESAQIAGIADDGPGQSSSWADYDSDGDLDLFVANYFRCPLTDSYPDKLYRNEGDGTFSDQTDLLHVDGSTAGPGFQGAWFDYDRDGDVDLYLANDFWGKGAEPNFLWRNDGPDGVDGWRFVNVSRDTGAALSINTMGIGVGDYDRDRDLDLALSNIRPAKLLRNEGGTTFSEIGVWARVGGWTQDADTPAITWGPEFIDLNNDGWEDLYIAAGSTSGGDRFQPNYVFTNARDGRFLDHRAPSGAGDTAPSRAVVPADYDRDGRVDLFVVNNSGSPRLYRNVTGGRAHWLEVDLKGTVGSRDPCGALVLAKLKRAVLMRQVMCGGTSLGSSRDRVVHFGLGRAEKVRKLIIRWPSGQRQTLHRVPANRVIEIVEPSESRTQGR